MNVLDVIRNTPPEYPWEWTPRQRLQQAINFRYRTMCALKVGEAAFDGLASVVDPHSTRSHRRYMVNAAVSLARDYFGMAATR